MTTAFWLFAISIAASAGFVLGAIMTAGSLADDAEEAAPQRRTKITLRGNASEPHLVLISPTERRKVKSV